MLAADTQALAEPLAALVASAAIGLRVGIERERKPRAKAGHFEVEW